MSATQPEWIAVCRLDDIPPLGARVLTREAGTPIALFRTASDAVFALLDRCPHKGGPLSQGIVHGEQVTCPLHGFNVAFSSGCALPPDEGCTSVFSVKRDGDSEIVAYRQVGSYPVFVSCAYRTSAIRHAWYEHLSVLFISMFAPSAALWGVIWLSLKRLRAEEQAWERWQAEASMRRSIESAYRQSRKMETLGNLVGSVAHDFNNLLMIISSNVQIARRRGVQHLDTELAAIERALKNGQSLTRQLLGVARKQPLRSETIDIAHWLASCRELLKTSLGSKSTLAVDTQLDLWPVRVDVAELELAMINLAVNARDAMPQGGRFKISAHNITFRREDGFPLTGDFVQISVEDTGLGMSPEVLARAFEPLFTTKAKGMGTGLGLPQVFAFCERSGGLATIDSEVGAGTSVRLYLPRTTDAVPPVDAPNAVDNLAASTPAGLRILLVEDNGEVAAGTEALLELLGHQVTHAPNADDALRMLNAAGAEPGAPGTFDLVISDIHMPGTINGIDLAEAIERGDMKLPVILVTGYAEEFDRTRRVHARLLSKPFDIALLDDLLQKIQHERDARLAPVDALLSTFPCVKLDAALATRFLHGQRLKLSELAARPDAAEGGRVRVYDADDRLLGVARASEGVLAPERLVVTGA